MWKLIRRVTNIVLTLIGLAAVLLVALPTGRYLLRAAWEEGKILLRRRPIAEVAADSTVNAQVRVKLDLVTRVRAFAASDLQLKAGESFTTYSRVDHDTLVLVLSGAYRDRLQPYTWWFPIVGRVPYKGFFDFAAARRARDDLTAAGFDTYLRPAAAFSTLGWFNDPLLSTTLEEDSLTLANTVIHELAHNTLFVKNHVDFNESFASFVGARGAARFFRADGDSVAALGVEAMWEDEKRLGAFWEQLAHAIDSAYARFPDDSAQRVAAAREVYTRARRDLVERLAPMLPTVPSEWLARLQLDNAALLARRVYGKELGMFDQVFRREGDSVPAAVARIAALVRGADDPYAAVREWLGQRPEAKGQGG